MKKILSLSLVIMGALSACQNQDWDFPDYDYQSVYFAYQYPIRTITLGEDIFDTSLDNAHKCKIMATTGGVYKNGKNVTIDFTVDNSLCNGLAFNNSGLDVLPMPSNYYTLASNQIVIPKGELSGGVEVQLTDAFFADPLALSNNYVIPVVMTKVANADTILAGSPFASIPNRCVTADWNVVPKDYILYSVKYVNPWHGYYLRRGKDVITGKNGNTALDKTIVRHKQYVESDEVCKLTTQSLTKTTLPLIFKDVNGQNINCLLTFTFDNSGNCTVSTDSQSFTVTGSGKFVTDGEKKSWGNTDRDAIYVKYEIDLNDMHVSSTDTLVLRNRGVAMETFTPMLK